MQTGPTAGPERLGGAVQQLHLVGFTTDHKGLILSARRGAQEGGYVVTLDRQLVDQIEELLRLQADEGGGAAHGTARNGTAPVLRRPKAESRLTPREVQSMLRTGHSVGEIAETAGMSEEWVARFAPPVLAEQARVVARALDLTYTKPRLGPSILPLGESVVWNLADRGVVLTGDAFEEAWSAFQLPDGGWVVRVSYLAERRRQHADWIVEIAEGGLRAVNRLGNELGFVEPGRRRPQVLPAPAPVSAAAQRAAAAPSRPATPPPLPARASGRLSMLGSAPGSRPTGLVRSANPEPYRDPRPSDRAPARSSKPPAPQASVLPPRPVDPSLVSVPEVDQETTPEFAAPLPPLPPPPVVAHEDGPVSHVRLIPAEGAAGATSGPAAPAASAARTGPLPSEHPEAEEVSPEAQVSRSPSGSRRARRAGGGGSGERRPRPLRPASQDDAARARQVRAESSTDATRTGAAGGRDPRRDPTTGSRATATRVRRPRPLRTTDRDELNEPEPLAPRVRRPLAPSRALPSPRPSRSSEPRPRVAVSGSADRPGASGRPRRLVAARPIEPTDDVRPLAPRRTRTADRAQRVRYDDDRDAPLSRSSDTRARSDSGRYRLRPSDRPADRGVMGAERLGTGGAEGGNGDGGAATAGSLAGRRRLRRATDPLAAGPSEATTAVEPDAGYGRERPRPRRASRERDDGGPITAPTPIVRVFDDYDAPLGNPAGDVDEPVRSRDTVLIRAGQAGTPEQTSAGPSAAGSEEPTPAARTARPGRLRLRRRFSGSP